MEYQWITVPFVFKTCRCPVKICVHVGECTHACEWTCKREIEDTHNRDEGRVALQILSGCSPHHSRPLIMWVGTDES